MLIQHFSDHNWSGGTKFDDSLSIPKNRAQIEKSLGISNNLYWSGSDVYRPYFLRMGRTDPTWTEPPRKEVNAAEEVVGGKRKKTEPGDKWKNQTKKSRAETDATSSTLHRQLRDEMDEAKWTPSPVRESSTSHAVSLERTHSLVHSPVIPEAQSSPVSPDSPPL